MLKAFSLVGKTALVTGGGRGIGKAIALTFAEAGADVAVAARTGEEIEQSAAEIKTLGRRSLAIKTDVSDDRQVEEMVAKATEHLSRIDILVN
ncbi:MAG: SDR family NAD(P)-dependent oxidoreductase, partial [Dehalococcoidia bacterium]